MPLNDDDEDDDVSQLCAKHLTCIHCYNWRCLSLYNAFVEDIGTSIFAEWRHFRTWENDPATDQRQSYRINRELLHFWQQLTIVTKNE